MHIIQLLILLLLLALPASAQRKVVDSGQTYTITGTVYDDTDKSPLSYTTVRIESEALWAITDDNGHFSVSSVKGGWQTVVISSLGYKTRSMRILVSRDTDMKTIRLKPDNLLLGEVEVTAQRRAGGNTTSYVMSRNTLDHQQMLNVTDIASLLPGGKTVNSTLTDDNQLNLRSGASERGNADFGTAIEVDGIRLDNNGLMDNVRSASTRSLSSSNVESVEVISGVPSVEYGDISNGIVKVNTRHGRSPFIFEASTNQHTKQVALNKGFALPKGWGLMNFSLEHARSYTSTSSPYTSYQRNTLSIGYSKTLNLNRTTLNIKAGVTGNIGGRKNEADPDALVTDYDRIRDNQLRGNIDLSWLINNRRIGALNFNLHTAISTQDKLATYSVGKSASAAIPLIHTMQTGYFIANDYDTYMAQNPGATGVGAILLSPTGYWTQLKYSDQKPLTFSLKLKANWTKHFSGGNENNSIVNNLLLGMEFNSSRNNGRGIYYEDMRYADDSWRPYDYSTLPAMKNVAIFAEDKLTLGRLQLTAGVRDDITLISGSDYGTVSSFSPRFNAKYDIIPASSPVNRSPVSRLLVHIGYGKSVKLPSFQILYPEDRYVDRPTFTPASTDQGKAFYAYNTYVQKAQHNADLRWQYTNQLDAGIEGTVHGIHLSLSAFYHKTYNPYQLVRDYIPYTYNYTDATALETCGIPSADRVYSVNQQTGIVTVTSSSSSASMVLPYTVHQLYTSNPRYQNGSPVERYGLEWIVELPQWKALHTTLRLDGRYYHYKGVDETLIAGTPNATADIANPLFPTAGTAYPLIGYYLGSNVTSSGAYSQPTASNGMLSKQVNLNATLTTHIPKLRLIMTLRVEGTFLNFKRQLSESPTGSRGVLLAAKGDVFGTDYTGQEDGYVAIYPEYYSTWDNPSLRMPFAEALVNAYQNDPALYQSLRSLIVTTPTSYYLNPASLSPYFSANFSVTKEIGNHLSISFYANNFLNTMSKVTNSQTGLEESLFNSAYVPKFYYGLSVRLKI